MFCLVPSPTSTKRTLTELIREQLQATLGQAYRIERELGGGGMSRVFIAEETAFGRQVVVKVLPPELMEGVSVERFNREILLAAKLQHPHIVPVLTAGETQGLPFYTMPLVEGESLRARLSRTGSLPITEAVSVLRDVARALAYAHERGIVHRDIKPDNVLLTGGSATVTDFGIAKAFSASRTRGSTQALTQVGTSIGTPVYMSPEQAAGDPDTDHRSDIYSFGCMAYELLAGQPPFVEASPRKLLAAHMGAVPRNVGELRPDAPPALVDLVMRCLAKDADERPQQAAELARTLDTVSSGAGIPNLSPMLLGGPGMFRKALLLYAVVFAIVAIIAKAAIVGIGLPDWVFPGSLLVMALGLPMVLWTGYVQRVARRAIAMTPTFTPGGSPATAHGAMAGGQLATMALKAAPRMSWYRTARGGLYALGAFVVVIAAFMGMRAFGVGPFGSLLARGALNAREQVILTDFRATNTDSTLGRVVSDAVRAGLVGSTAFTMYTPAQIVAALGRMRQPKDEPITLTVANEIAAREGVKAIVDGEVTGVGTGYIVTLRLVRADSGTELASFRESGDGPRGLIDAADKLARALRSKAGESLRSVNATPPLSRVTTASLDALRKYGEGNRMNAQGNGDGAIAAEREAVAFDSTFASGWSALGAFLSNWFGSQSAIDSALTKAFQYRDNASARERSGITARYFSNGPGRDRNKAAAAYEEMARQGDSVTSVINLGEQLRTKREFARAESLDAVALRRSPNNGIALLNLVQLQINQAKFPQATATLHTLDSVAPNSGAIHRTMLAWAEGDFAGVRRVVDSLVSSRGPQAAYGERVGASVSLLQGRFRDANQMKQSWNGESAPVTRLLISGVNLISRGPDPDAIREVDAALAGVRFQDLAQVDRPYLFAARLQAMSGNVTAAKAMVARYRNEVTDTSIRRVQQPDVHEALGFIALAESKPQVALDEFRRADVGWDGAPVSECAACVYINLAHALDAAAMPDSAIAMFERYVATPFYSKLDPRIDPANLPAVRERLGQLYEAKGNKAKALENYRAFIDLWRNADAEVQPRVEEARRRVAKLAPG